MTDRADEDREFWLGQRSGLLKQVEAIERRYLPDKFQERLGLDAAASALGDAADDRGILVAAAGTFKNLRVALGNAGTPGTSS